MTNKSEGLFIARLLMVLSSISPLFILWVIRGANVKGLLEIIVRRRYDVDLIESSIEVFRASGRSPISQGGN